MVDKKELGELKRKIAIVLRRYNVKRAGIFGSYARGEQKKNSDVDILVEICNEFDLIEFIRLKNLIENEIKKKIDLVEYDTIKPELRNNILGEEIRIEI